LAGAGFVAGERLWAVLVTRLAREG